MDGFYVGKAQGYQDKWYDTGYTLTIKDGKIILNDIRTGRPVFFYKPGKKEENKQSGSTQGGELPF